MDTQNTENLNKFSDSDAFTTAFAARQLNILQCTILLELKYKICAQHLGKTVYKIERKRREQQRIQQQQQQKEQTIQKPKQKQ